MIPQVVPPDSTVTPVDTASATDSLVSLIAAPVEEAFQNTRSWLDNIGDYVVQNLPTLITAFFVLLLFILVYRIGDRVLARALRRSQRISPHIREITVRGFHMAIWLVAALVVLNILGVNVGAFLAGLGIAGLALGFAAKDSLENLISGITILLDVPFEIGDNIIVDGTFGTVETITLRSTRIRTPSQEIVIIPNMQMINQKVINRTKLPVLRLEIPFGIAYKESPQRAREVVLATTQADERLRPEMPADVVVMKMNDSSIDLMLRIWIRNPHQEISIRADYTERIFNALRKADIEIPFPHLQLFIDDAKGLEKLALLNPGYPPPQK